MNVKTLLVTVVRMRLVRTQVEQKLCEIILHRDFCYFLLDGNYTCECNKGFIGNDAGMCDDINECETEASEYLGLEINLQPPLLIRIKFNS